MLYRGGKSYLAEEIAKGTQARYDIEAMKELSGTSREMIVVRA